MSADAVNHAEDVEPTEGSPHSDNDVLTESQSDIVVSTVGRILPLRVLLLRRGLTLLAMITILIVGLVIYATVKR